MLPCRLAPELLVFLRSNMIMQAAGASEQVKIQASERKFKRFIDSKSTLYYLVDRSISWQTILSLYRPRETMNTAFAASPQNDMQDRIGKAGRAAKNWLIAAFLLASTASSATYADNRGLDIAVSAAAGLAIGELAAGKEGALIGGLLGAAVGIAASEHDDPIVSYVPPPVYLQPLPVHFYPPVHYRDRHAGHRQYGRR